MSIVRTLLISIVIVILAMFGLLAVVYNAERRVDSAVSEFSEKTLPGTIALQKLATDVANVRRYEKEYFVFLGNVERRNGYFKEWGTAMGNVLKSLDTLVANTDKQFASAETLSMSEWRASLKGYADGFDGIVNRVGRGDITDPVVANTENGKNVDLIRKAQSEIPQLAAKRVSDAQLKGKLALAEQAKAKNLVLSIAALIIVLLVVLAIVLPRRIKAPIDGLSEVAEQLSKGQMDVSFEKFATIVEFKPLVEALERMRRTVSQAVQRLQRR